MEFLSIGRSVQEGLKDSTKKVSSWYQEGRGIVYQGENRSVGESTEGRHQERENSSGEING